MFSEINIYDSWYCSCTWKLTVPCKRVHRSCISSIFPKAPKSLQGSLCSNLFSVAPPTCHITCPTACLLGWGWEQCVKRQWSCVNWTKVDVESQVLQGHEAIWSVWGSLLQKADLKEESHTQMGECNKAVLLLETIWHTIKIHLNN